MRVGILCECSGAVRDAFLRRGHDAVSCDLKPTRAPGPHIVGDCLEQDWAGYELLIMHPPCTYLASSGLHWNLRRPARVALTDEALGFVRRMMALPVPCWALENPIGCISTKIRKPDQIIQPWMFGHGETKATCLWLKGLPGLRPTDVVDGREPRIWRMGPGPDRAEARSVTYAGVAEAMADQWTDLSAGTLFAGLEENR